MKSPARPELLQDCALLAIAIFGCSIAPPPERPVAPQPRAIEPAPELELLAALPIEAPESFQPSGLWFEQGRLLVVSDKHEDTVYELGLEAERAVARPFLQFERLPDVADHLDWEGVSGDGAGGLLLVSESAYRVARIEVARGVGPPASTARWITPSLHAAGEAAGCFQAPNAGFEGLARLDTGELLLAIERRPRGLMDVSVDSGEPVGRTQAMLDSIYPVRPGRVPDFADLTVAESNVYALMRNGHLVVRLERRAGAWVEERAVSYAAAENDARFIYADDEFGLGEGLALTADRIFVVLDNNGQARVSAPKDSRPLLFVFRRPPGF